MLYTLWDLCTGEAHVTVLDITHEVHVQKAVVTGDKQPALVKIYTYSLCCTSTTVCIDETTGR